MAFISNIKVCIVFLFHFWHDFCLSLESSSSASYGSTPNQGNVSANEGQEQNANGSSAFNAATGIILRPNENFVFLLGIKCRKDLHVLERIIHLKAIQSNF